MSDITIRQATVDDVERLLEIYSPYVQDTALTFISTPPTKDEYLTKLRQIVPQFPFLCAIRDNKIVGFAYASSFRNHKAYSHIAEVKTYVCRESKRTGIGRSLHKVMERLLAKQEIYNIYVCIPHTEVRCQYLSHDTEDFHERLGYKRIAKLNSCGFKFNQWFDIVLMEKIISLHKNNAPEFIPFSKLHLSYDDYLV